MRKTAKVLSLMLAVVFVFTALVGCGSSSSSNDTSTIAADKSTADAASAAPAEEKKQTIRVQTTFTGADPFTPVWQQALKDFQAKYPYITVVDEATSAAGDAFKTKINTDFASGNEPDVAYAFNSTTSKPIVDSGKVISWEDELKADPEWASTFAPAPLESCKFQDKLYALPWIGFYEGMFVNKDVFESNGLALPKTWDDVQKAIPVLNAKNITPIAVAFSDEPHYFIEDLLLSMGGATGHANPFDASWAPALKLIKELYDAKAFSADAITLKQTSAATLFATKKAAMWVSGSWSAGQITDKDNTIVMPFPMVPGAKANPTDIIGGSGTGWYLSKALNDSKDGAGMKFIKFITSPEQLAKFTAVAGVPCIKLGAGTGTLTPLDKSASDFMGAAASINSPIGDLLGQEVFGAIWRGAAYVATGKKTPEQVLEEAQKLYKK